MSCRHFFETMKRTEAADNKKETVYLFFEYLYPSTIQLGYRLQLKTPKVVICFRTLSKIRTRTRTIKVVILHQICCACLEISVYSK